jgi:hypothetical protein
MKKNRLVELPALPAAADNATEALDELGLFVRRKVGSLSGCDDLERS